MINKTFKEKAVNRRLIFADSCNIESACWSQLVSWVFGRTNFEDCFSQICRPPGMPYAYCGKCDKYFDDVQK